jgi:hypothetical protein
MYKWLHLIGKRREHNISEQTVKRLNCPETKSTFRSQARVYQANRIFPMSKHSNNTLKGKLTYATG